MTGMTETECASAGLSFGMVTVSGPSHASYYPGSNNVTLKVVYEKGTGRLLGTLRCTHFCRALCLAPCH
jgi:hypothetical protein